jgi:hypothetical protein
MTSRVRRGSITGYVLLSMTVVLVASLGAASFSLGSLARAQRDRDALIAFQAAQAGLELGISKALEMVTETGGDFVYAEYSVGGDLGPIAENCTGVIEIVPQALASRAWVTSTVTYLNVTKSVRSQLTAKDVGIWNNAVFAGTGASGQAINGNVDMRGSVHILGDGEPYSDLNGNGQWDGAEPFTDLNGNGVWDPGEPFIDINGDGVWNPAEPFNDTNGNGKYDPPLTQTDLNSSLSGTAYVGNNYSGIPLALSQLLPDPPRINGIQTLGTEVRVKHGRISISGNAKIGTAAEIDGGSSKNTIDGSYVNDGYTGNAGADSVFSDNGTKEVYDLGNLGIKFPLLGGIGAQPYLDSSGNAWTTQEQYLESESLTIPVSTITSTTAAFSYSDANGNSISFTPASSGGGSPAMISITGIVRIAGDLQLGAKDTIRYQGNGTLYTTGHMYIDGDVLPAAGTVFPTTARMGFITKKNMHLATGNGSAQLSMAGAFYAQGKIISQKQNRIAGTFVANYFDMGTNVPSIYQVPNLAQNMPPGMPGDQPFVTLKAIGWRERFNLD